LTQGGRKSKEDVEKYGGSINDAFGPNVMSEEEAKERFLKHFESDSGLAKNAEPLHDLIWEYRDVFGDDILQIKEGIISYEVELGCTLDNLKPPKFMNQGPVKKEALRQYLEIYELAGVVKKTSNEAFLNAFLVKKPGHITKNQEKMDDHTFAKNGD
jgi:hypothetical protein